MERQEAGFKLYVQGVSLDEIASIFKVKYPTVAKWSSDKNWKDRKNERLIREETTQEAIMDLISYQLMVIKKIKELNLEKLDTVEDINELKELLISRGDIDALQKLHTTIKTKEVTWDSIVQITRELTEFLSSKDMKATAKLAEFINEWLNEKRKRL